MKKKIISFLVAFIMLVSSIATINFSAFAANLTWPVPGHKTLSRGYHDGSAIDISDGSINGAKVVAAIGGKVTHKFTCSHNTYPNTPSCCYGFGTGIVISGNDGRTYQYAHMQSGSVPSSVYVGATVSQGQEIGKVGNTGNSTGAHLHFGISYGNYWNQSGIDPSKESYTTDVNITFANLSATNIGNNSVTLSYKTNNSTSASISNFGLQIKRKSASNWEYTHKENYATSYSAPVSTYQVGSGKEVNCSLQAGTAYEWRPYVISGGKTYYGSVASFTTTGSSHTHSYTQKVSKATFSSPGVITKTCSCGSTSVVKSIQKVNKVSLSTSVYTYNGNAKKPSVTVEDSAGNKLSTDSYSVQYETGRKNVGKYAVKVTLKGNYSGSKTVYFTIKPKPTSIKSLTAKSKGFTVKWNKVTTQTTGYQVRFSTKSDMSNSSAFTVSNSSTVSKSVTKLKAKKKYYVQIRTYKTVNGTKYYSAWSSAKSVTTK